MLQQCLSCTEVGPSYLSGRWTVTSLYLGSKKVEVHFSIHGFSSYFEPSPQCFKAAECHSCADGCIPRLGRVADAGFPVFLLGFPAVAGRSTVLKHWGTALPMLCDAGTCVPGAVFQGSGLTVGCLQTCGQVLTWLIPESIMTWYFES